MGDHDFMALGKPGQKPARRLETFAAPAGLAGVVLESDEVTSLCPVTGQPDWETVRIEFKPNHLCIESKSLKLYLWSFRDEGVFCEALACQIAQDVAAAIKPEWVLVTVSQKARGGITIQAQARVPQV